MIYTYRNCYISFIPLSDILIEMFEYILIEKLLHILIEQLIYLCQSFYKYISISIYYHKHTTNAIDIVNKNAVRISDSV